MPEKSVTVAQTNIAATLFGQHYYSGGFGKPYCYPGGHEGLDDSAMVLSWEQGPDEWVFDDEAIEKITKTLHEAYGIELRFEPINHWCLGVYAKEA